MTKLCLFLLMTAPAFAQSVLEGPGCDTAKSISSGSPAILTCNTPHGFDAMPAQALMGVSANPLANSTFTLDGVTYTFRSSLAGCSARDILINTADSSGAGTLYNLLHAIMADGFGSGTNWCASTTAHPTVNAYKGGANGIMLAAITGGPAGIGKTWSQSGSAFYFNQSDIGNPSALTPATSLQIVWALGLSGATGSWFPVNNQRMTISLGSLTPTSTTVYVPDSSVCKAPCTIRIGNEKMLIGSVTGGYRWNVTTRGYEGTTAAVHNGIYNYNSDPSIDNAPAGHESQDIFVDVDNPGVYEAIYLDSTHIQLNRTNTTSYGSFAGQTVNVRRMGHADLTAPLYFQAPTPEYAIGAASSASAADGLHVNFPPDCVPGGRPYDFWACMANYGGMTQRGNPGYPNQDGVAYPQFTSMVVDSTTNTGTVTLKTPWVQAGGTTYNFRLGGIVFVQGMTNSALNIAYVVKGMTGAGTAGNPVTQVQLDTSMSGVSSGAYTGGAAAPTCHVSPCFVINYPVSPYVYFNVLTTNGGSVRMYPIMSPGFASKGGSTFNKNSNRFYTWMKPSKTVPNEYRTLYNLAAGNGSIGHYNMNQQNPENPDAILADATAHYYTYIVTDLYAGQWQKYFGTNTPTYLLGTNPPYMYNADPTWTGTFISPSSGRHFWDDDSLIYFQVNADSGNHIGNSYVMGKSGHFVASHEPEEIMHSAAITYTGTQYEVSFYGTPHTNISYKFRYSTSDMTSIGFSNGTDGGAAIGSTQDVNGGNLWMSAATANLGNVYFGVRPTYTIGGCSGTGQSPIWCVLDYNVDTSYQVGDHVTVSNVRGNVAANQPNVAISAVQPRQFWYRFDPQKYVSYTAQAFTNSGGLVEITTGDTNFGGGNTAYPHNFHTGDMIQCFTCGGNIDAAQGHVWTITVIDSTHFTLNGSTFTSGYTPYISNSQGGGQLYRSAPAQINDITSQSGTCTVHMNVPHNIFPGWKVEVVNTPSANIGGLGVQYNYYKVLTTPTASSFTFACPGESQSTPIVYNYDAYLLYRMTIIAFPGIAVPPQGTQQPADYTSGGNVVATDDTKNFMQLYFDPPTGAGPVCTISPTSVGPYSAGQSVNQTFTATNCNASTWSATGLTGSGLTLNSSGVLSSPSVAGTYNVTISYDTASQPMTITVTPAAPASSTAPGVVGAGVIR
jgi:hypothetical protein